MSATQTHGLIPFIGSPNSGKTTLYNWVTGSRFKAVNYPGATVDYSKGVSLSLYGRSISVLDTPGTYSLKPQSPEEEVTYRLLFGSTLEKLSRTVVVVVDSTQLSRHLPLVLQTQTCGFDVVIALTMVDLLKKDLIDIDIKLLSELTKVPVFPIDGSLGGGVKALVEHLNSMPIIPAPEAEKEIRDAVSESIVELHRKSKEISNLVFTDLASGQLLSATQRTRKWDQVLLHKIWGPIIFILIMLCLFSSIFWAAAPFMDIIDETFAFLATQALHFFGDGLLANFISDGLISSMGAVLVFVPQIFILFFGIALLEDSGYLARAASIIDRPFTAVGLNGRAFVPVLSGFACAVPAIMACRTIGSRTQRLITMMIIPFLTCSARLPVFALLLTFLFAGSQAWKAGLAMTALYMGSLIIGALAAAVLSRFIKDTHPSGFMLELPIYRKPLVKFAAKSALIKTTNYVKRAGPIIFTLAILIWAGTTFPHYEETNQTARIEHSYLGKAGQMIEPIFKPMGIDWQGGVGLLSAFAAREVFVSTMAILYNITEDDEDRLTDSLIGKMKAAKWKDGSPIYTTASVAALILFFMLALQCISTTGVAIREMNSWSLAMVQLIGMNLFAYAAAVGVFQLLSIF